MTSAGSGLCLSSRLVTSSMCDSCCDFKETVYIELVDGVTAEVVYDRVDLEIAEENGNQLISLEVKSLMMMPAKLQELMDRI